MFVWGTLPPGPCLQSGPMKRGVSLADRGGCNPAGRDACDRAGGREAVALLVLLAPPALPAPPALQNAANDRRRRSPAQPNLAARVRGAGSDVDLCLRV